MLHYQEYLSYSERWRSLHQLSLLVRAWRADATRRL